ITLDVRLPDMDGLTLLDRLKNDEATRHIPAEIISIEDVRGQALRMGAFGYLQKPADAEGLGGVLGELRAFVADDGRSILVVDDDVRNIFAITAALERYDARVLFADNGKEGLELLEKNAVDLILMDIMMPEMDGYEVMRRIRQQERFRSLPIIAVTA